MSFQKGDRVLAQTSPYKMNDDLGTVLAVINTDSFLVKIDEDGSEHEVHEDKIMYVREEVRTDPNSCRGELVCKNCGWSGSGSHVWFAPHYCQEPETRDRKPILPNSQVFEAHVFMPIRAKRPDGTWIDRKYVEAMKKFDPSVLRGR
jgi:hypothetical protein